MKRILLALALLPALSLPALAEEKVEGYSVGTRQSQTLTRECTAENKGALVFVNEYKTYVVCNGENWRKVVLGEAVEPTGDRNTEGYNK